MVVDSYVYLLLYNEIDWSWINSLVVKKVKFQVNSEKKGPYLSKIDNIKDNKENKPKNKKSKVQIKSDEIV